VSRVGIAGLWHETNTCSARPTDLDAFRAFELLAGEEVFSAHRDTGSVIGGMLEAKGFDPVPVMTAGAWPAGRVTQSALDELLGRFDAQLRKAGRLDGLLLDLHGAMVGEGLDDVEEAVLALVREAFGETPVVVVHDLHGNPSPQLVALCMLWSPMKPTRT
jgi:microcystin degradation protein MlrC